MTLKIGINGFGRIGRLVARAVFELDRDDVELVAINDPGGNFFPLLKYDSVHGKSPFDVEKIDEDWIRVAGKKVRRFRTRNIDEINWAEEGVDIVMECTGKFRDAESAGAHIKSGAKKVLISAPGKDVPTVVYGVNDDIITASDLVVSNASCTTNCLAPVAYVLDKEIGIKSGFMTTIHAYTGDQNIIDGSHKDPYRARAAAMSMIPTSTGAAKAVGLVLPQLQGKLDGVAMRVPTANVSAVDLKFIPEKSTDVEAIHAAMQKYAGGELAGILGVNSDPCVSIDFNHDPHSSVFDLNGTKVMEGGNLVRILAWYDNEWGFSIRMLDTALKMHNVGYA